MKISSKHLGAPIKNTEEIPTETLFRVIGNPTKSINFLLPYLPRKYFDDFPFKESTKFTLMNGWHTNQDFEQNWRSGYNRVRLFFTKPYLINTKEIVIKRKVSNDANNLSMYVYINGEPIDRFILKGNQGEVIRINTIDAYTDQNVIEIGIADDSENSGAIWKPYDSNREFMVQRRVPHISPFKIIATRIRNYIAKLN